MRKNQIIFLITFLSTSLFGQVNYTDTLAKFGQISLKDLNYTSNDDEDEAVILFDIGEIKFIEGYKGLNTLKTHSKRIKILNEMGVDQANIYIPFYFYIGDEKESIKKYRSLYL